MQINVGAGLSHNTHKEFCLCANNVPLDREIVRKFPLELPFESFD